MIVSGVLHARLPTVCVSLCVLHPCRRRIERDTRHVLAGKDINDLYENDDVVGEAAEEDDGIKEEGPPPEDTPLA